MWNVRLNILPIPTEGIWLEKNLVRNEQILSTSRPTFRYQVGQEVAQHCKAPGPARWQNSHTYDPLKSLQHIWEECIIQPILR